MNEGDLYVVAMITLPDSSYGPVAGDSYSDDEGSTYDSGDEE